MKFGRIAAAAFTGGASEVALKVKHNYDGHADERAAAKVARAGAAQARAEAAQNIRVWTLTSRPGHVAAEFQKEIARQAADGFTLTSQNVSAGHSRTRTLQVMTAVFTRTAS